MYTSEFQEISETIIAQSVQNQGYFVCENSLDIDYLNNLVQEINFNPILVNQNDVGFVFSSNQRFLTHCLAKSKKVYDLITSDKILEICNEYFQERYQLTNHRICQTLNHGHMPWHTDNNLQIGNQLTGKHNMPGLLFLFYLSDIELSPFQYIKDSHHWSKGYNDEIYFDDAWIEQNYQQDILTFSMKKGGLIVCNTHGIHRVKPFCYHNYTRTLLLFQVDCIGSNNVGHGEQNLINTDFIDNFSPEIASYLGFGIRRDYPAFPNSNIDTMTIQDILGLQKRLLFLGLKALGKSIIKCVASESFIIKMKRLTWKFNQLKIINPTKLK